jgi:hypothetical protein
MPAYLITAAFCVALSFITVGILGLGVWGLIITQLVSHCVYNLWKWQLLVHEELKLSFFGMWKPAFIEFKSLLNRNKREI